MQKVVIFNGVEYDAALLIKTKGQGKRLDTQNTYCISDDKTIVSDQINIPIVARIFVDNEERLYMLVKPEHFQDKLHLQVVLFSKHILKKVTVERALSLTTPIEDNHYTGNFRTAEDNKRFENNRSNASHHRPQNSFNNQSPRGSYRQEQPAFRADNQRAFSK